MNIARIQTKGLLLQMGGGLLENRQIVVFCWQNRQTIGFQTLVNFAFGAGNIVHAIKSATNMRAHGVIDQRGIGFRQAREQRQFAKMVHAHFNHGIAMIFS